MNYSQHKIVLHTYLPFFEEGSINSTFIQGDKRIQAGGISKIVKHELCVYELMVS